MKKGPQKVIEIHEESTLGPPWVDFLTPWGDFGGCRKIVDFFDRPRGVPKSRKLSRGAAKGRQRGQRVSRRGRTLEPRGPRSGLARGDI